MVLEKLVKDLYKKTINAVKDVSDCVSSAATNAYNGVQQQKNTFVNDVKFFYNNAAFRTATSIIALVSAAVAALALYSSAQTVSAQEVDRYMQTREKANYGEKRGVREENLRCFIQSVGYESGKFTDDFDDGYIHSEWTTQGDVTEPGDGYLHLDVDSTTTHSLARTNSYNDQDQTMTAVFDGQPQSNGTGYYAQIGDVGGTDYARMMVRKTGFGTIAFTFFREGDLAVGGRDVGTTTTTNFRLEVKKENNLATGYVNGGQIGGSTDVPQDACGSVGARTFGSNSLTAKADGVEFDSLSISPPSCVDDWIRY